MGFASFFNQNIKPYMLYICLGASSAWVAWLISLEIPRWAFITLLIINPYVWYGAVMMWINRILIIAAYNEFKEFWRMRYPRK